MVQAASHPHLHCILDQCSTQGLGDGLQTAEGGDRTCGGSVGCRGASAEDTQPRVGWRQLPRGAMPALNLGHTDKGVWGSQNLKAGRMCSLKGQPVVPYSWQSAKQVTKDGDTQAMPRRQELPQKGPCGLTKQCGFTQNSSINNQRTEH